jgi:uncharacterized protein YndB with AHSA1/START domain
VEQCGIQATVCELTQRLATPPVGARAAMEVQMPYTYTLTSVIPATPQEIYDAWLDSLAHSEMTGSEAVMSGEVGADVSAWDGYITGRNLELVPGERIVQSWRTEKFGDEHEDSIVTVTLEGTEEGTLLTLVHSNVPDGQRSYEEGGWEENYFEPMRAYFARLDEEDEEEEGAEEAADAGEESAEEEASDEPLAEPAAPTPVRKVKSKAKRAVKRKVKKAAPRAKAKGAKKAKQKTKRAASRKAKAKRAKPAKRAASKPAKRMKAKKKRR